jgi:RNA polymerase sigma-70 factor (ECF subfamily)
MMTPSVKFDNLVGSGLKTVLAGADPLTPAEAALNLAAGWNVRLATPLRTPVQSVGRSPCHISAAAVGEGMEKRMAEPKPDSAETCGLLERIERGDHQALDGLLARHRPALRNFVDVHLDPRLRTRLDPSDVVQETQLEVVRRMGDFLKRRPMPFYLWLRKQTYERLLRLRRDHVGRGRRSVKREVPWPDRSSLLVARPLLSAAPSPSAGAEARELAEQVGQAVANLSEADREILLMRHAEELPYEEIGCLLDIEPPAARKRYGRAMIRLQRLLSEAGLLE